MRILIVDDERNIRESLKKYLKLEGIESETAEDGFVAKSLLAESTFDALVFDLKLPRMSGQELLEWVQNEGIRSPVIMISAHGEISDAVSALKSGASDYLTKPFDPSELVHKLNLLVTSRKREDLIEAGRRTAKGDSRLVGNSPAMLALKSLIDRVADSDATVLITGESGTGKEVVAREIHLRSAHAGDPFVAVNIGGIHESLMESELFGHERGAFTGATERKTGLFELAGKGTLFLDEIGEMPMPLQVKLLRVIQDRKIRRLGGTADLPVGARIISATNRDIESLVSDGRFREDLYYRLNVVRLPLPPLRERADDIPLLSGYLVDRVASRMGKPPRKISAGALEALMTYPFPGNIRELENILERALIYCEVDEITVADIDLHRGAEKPAVVAESPPASSSAASGPSVPTVPPPADSLVDIERNAIRQALAKWGGNRTKAALELGISRRTIINKIHLYGLE